MAAYYNEHDPYAAQWLRNLITAGHIAPGVVDDRDIRDVEPADLRGFTQCHFFAGVGVWSYALRSAGWPDDRPVWTGSCPCQPFSSAGRGAGFDDERHLWPHWFHLLEICRPPVLFGEQVASKDGLAWLDLVQADLEGAGYASAALDLCAAGVGAPHIRQRLYWVADFDAEGQRQRPERDGNPAQPGQQAPRGHDTGGRSGPGGLADTGSSRAGSTAGDSTHKESAIEGSHGGASGSGAPSGYDGASDGLAISRCGVKPESVHPIQMLDGKPRTTGPAGSFGGSSSDVAGRGVGIAGGYPGPTNGFWSSPDWLYCRDGKWRPVEPQSSALVNGSSGRVAVVRPGQEGAAAVSEEDIRWVSRTGTLRGFGNAIVAPLAEEFIRAYLSTHE